MSKLDDFINYLKNNLHKGNTREANENKIKKAVEEHKKNRKVILLDVRNPNEYNEGHLQGAILIPEYEIEEKALNKLKDKNQKIYVYCRSGSRARKAIIKLKKLGYTNLHYLGGIIV